MRATTKALKSGRRKTDQPEDVIGSNNRNRIEKFKDRTRNTHPVSISPRYKKIWPAKVKQPCKRWVKRPFSALPKDEVTLTFLRRSFSILFFGIV
jgi:hypothetical protein